jgi:hypothetical protein
MSHRHKTIQEAHAELANQDYRWLQGYWPRFLPSRWSEVAATPDGRQWASEMSIGGFWSVIMSGCVEQDGRRWIHLSTAMTERLPNWAELVTIRDTFLGANRKCIQILAPATEHVNVRWHCLHLWHCVDGDPLPDFTWGTGSI